MIVHPAIAKLRSDHALQLCARAEMTSAHDAWLQRSDVRAVDRDIRSYSEGQALEALPTLGGLIGDLARGKAFAHGMIDQFVPALRSQSLGEVPLRHTSTAGFARMQLMKQGGVVLSLCVYEPATANRQANWAQFADCELCELVLAGSATGRMHRIVHNGLGQGGIRSTDLNVGEGSFLAPKPRVEARQFEVVHRSLLVLQLTRTRPNPRATRELRLSDGALVREVSADRRASEKMMALGVLGALGMDRTIDPITAFARDLDQDKHARWEAARQLLALDGEAGWLVLNEIAHRPEDPLAQPSRSLMAQLREQHEIPEAQ
ncbi:hypothetical protein CD351_07130 [Erythrobacter sp. KY5]|uniref:hypothetical protein n=1 Tax=Erythrobacter sp. KY5 TaxID=2011159 RepID=UPI000DBF22C9|nr:hypothetical protein [Erythrobacter sp. KY5]AWW74200.1 hypothetical protein CD351_07130 [Erythrobacter sp. KY5]